MSRDTSDTGNPELRKGLSISDTLGVPNAPPPGKETADDLYSGSSVRAATIRDRIFGAKKEHKDSIMGWALISGLGKNSLQFAENFALDDRAQKQVADLTNATTMVGKTIGAASLAGLALQTAFVGLDVRDAAKNGKRGAAKRAMTNAADDAAKPAAKAAGTVVAREAVETAAPAAAKGLFGRVMSVGKWLGKTAKLIPGVGALVTAGFVTYEVASLLATGNKTAALAAATAGSVEIAGSIGGFATYAAGQAGRQAVKESFVAAGVVGKNEIMDSDAVALYKEFKDVASPATRVAAPVATFKPAMAYG